MISKIKQLTYWKEYNNSAQIEYLDFIFCYWLAIGDKNEEGFSLPICMVHSK